MSGMWLQFLVTGITVGAIYALVALGFSIVFNASGVINFAQGEFVMIGGMSAVSLLAMGAPMALALPGAVGVAALVGLGVEKLAIERVAPRRRRDADHHHDRRVDLPARPRAARVGQERRTACRR